MPWYFAYGSNMDADRLFEKRLKPKGSPPASASAAASTAGA